MREYDRQALAKDLIDFLNAQLDEEDEQLDAVDHTAAPLGNMEDERKMITAHRRIVFLAERMLDLSARDLFDNNRDAWVEVLAQLAAAQYESRPGYDRRWNDLLH